MRFYRITITDTTGSAVLINGAPMSFSSHDDAGRYKRGALNVEFDIPVVTADVPAGNGFVKIWGVDLQTLNMASTLNLKNIRIEAGMMPGLPLATEQAQATPLRKGIIFEGSIFQAFGNWQGTEQSLDLIVTVQLTAKPQDAPKTTRPMVFQAKAGQSFQGAIEQSMAASGITSKVQVDSRIVATDPIIFQHDNVTDFAAELLYHSKKILRDPNYHGIKMVKRLYGYDVMDSTAQTAEIEVKFNDLIGQPTWLDFLQVQMKTVMRSDIAVGYTVRMPKEYIAKNTARIFAAAKEGIAFSGTGWVNQVRHVGNYRQQDANSWITIIDSILNTK